MGAKGIYSHLVSSQLFVYLFSCQRIFISMSSSSTYTSHARGWCDTTPTARFRWTHHAGQMLVGDLTRKGRPMNSRTVPDGCRDFIAFFTGKI